MTCRSHYLFSHSLRKFVLPLSLAATTLTACFPTQALAQATGEKAAMASLEAVKNYAARPYVAKPDARLAAMPTAEAAFVNRLQNGGFEDAKGGLARGWEAWKGGGKLAPGQGRNNSTAFVCERGENDPEAGVQQVIALNQTQREPVLVEGWSRAEKVSGSTDKNYSLYCDVTYTDGTNLWGVIQGFSTSTRDWQRAQVVVMPQKPIQSLTVYGLFRGHTGKVWFDDFSASTRRLDGNAAFFNGVPVQVLKPGSGAPGNAKNVATKDGLALQVDERSGRVASLRVGENGFASAAPGGFLVRDVANNSGFYAFENGDCAPLRLKLESSIEEHDDHIAISGHIEDTTKLDRAVSLVFALPLDARGWTWGNDVRANQRIGTSGEYSNATPIGAGANGNQSVYPFANVHDESNGVALALDMNFPAQYQLGYNADTQQYFIAYDFGLTPEKPRADFRFVIYRSDPRWGFRAAAEKLYRIFPAYFAVPEAAAKQGLWMPFQAIGPIEGWEDFGFRFREAGGSALQNGSAAWDDEHDILTLIYSEPMTYWMPMPVDMPRTYEAAIGELARIAADARHPQRAMANAVISSGMRDETGRLATRFENRPWGNGAVWSINPSPGLNKIADQAGSTPEASPEAATGASLVWNKDKLARLTKPAGARPDGEYLDSFEGYVTTELNYAREQFAASSVPLTFTTSGFTPVQHKGLLVTEMARWMSREVRAAGGLMMANSIPYRFGMAVAWLDVMGTETNWNRGGKYSPDSDTAMNLRRTLSGQKPYLLLQNTDFNNFGNELVKRYMEQCLFYGVFPSFFSQNAATDVYWANPKLYNRDRELFKKYIPLVKTVAEAGWQPVTHATADNASVWLERFGDADAVYLTLRNAADTPQKARVALAPDLRANSQAQELLSNAPLRVNNGMFEIELLPEQTAVVRVR